MPCRDADQGGRLGGVDIRPTECHSSRGGDARLTLARMMGAASVGAHVLTHGASLTEGRSRQAGRLREPAPRTLGCPPDDLASGQNESTQSKPAIEADGDNVRSEHNHWRDGGEIVWTSVTAMGASAASRIQDACRT